MNNQMRSVGIRVTAENKGVTTAMRDVRREMDETAKTAERSSTRTGKASADANQRVKRANDDTRSSLKATERAYKDTGDAGEGAFTRVGASGKKLAGAAGLGLIGKQVYDIGMGFLEFKQNSELAFTTMLGSGDKARTFLADILAFAKETPFAFTDLTDSAQRMLAFGIETEKVIPILRTLGDTALGTGGGVEKMNGIVTAISQISAKGRVQSEELLQLSERGVPALRILANQAGKTAGALQKDITKGLIDADQAIEWLVDGLENGTQGINGTTAAFGGLMEQVKGSGGITATFDSAKSSFRNMAGAIMEGLAPSIITLVNAGTDLMSVIQWLAGRFADLPRPIRDAALAVGALVIAQRLMGSSATTMAMGPIRSLSTAYAQVALGAQDAGRELTRARVVGTLAMNGLKTSATGLKTALMGAFGGPVGIAIAGLTLGMSAYASSTADAKARAEELLTTLDEVGNKTDETRNKIIENLSEKSGKFLGVDWSGRGGGSVYDDAEKLGLSLDLVTDAALGSGEALKEFKRLRDAVRNGPDTPERAGQMLLFTRVSQGIEAEVGAIETAIEIAEQKNRVDDDSAESTKKLGSAYADATRQAINFADSNDVAAKAVQSAADAAANAFASGTSAMSMKLDLSTDKDVENARDAVKKATNSVKDAEGSLSKARSAKKPDAETIRRAEQSLADARKAAKEASDNLADTEKRNDPVGQYRRQLKEQQKAAETFRDDMIKLAERGLNGQSLQELLTQGVEGSADTRKALLGDKKLIGKTNDFQTTMDGIAGEIETLARVNAARLNTAGGVTAEEFNLGLRVAMEGGAETSLSSLATKLGEDPSRLREVGRLLGIEFVTGFSDAGIPWAPTPQKPGPPRVPGFANGGIYPGYTPGRDIGFIGVSGGEAIMRPEFTRAVGPDWVHRMNALARSVGAAGVQREMGRYLGGFANGGVPVPQHVAPQVIRLTESQTVGYPMTVENLTVQSNNAADLERQLRAQRRRAFTGGRP